MGKRLFDITVAAGGLIVLAPVILAVAALVRLESRGPLIFRGRRVGRNGELFDIFKFRTMRETPESYSGPRITACDDPRVTRLGRFLRDTKLNELPQLFNVLRGEMSIVGPRPEDPAFVEHYTDEQREVLSARPGITGMSVMVHVDEERVLRSVDASAVYLESIMPDKLRIELVYVRNRSFVLDLDILLRTFVILIPGLRKKATTEQLLDGPLRRAGRAATWFAVDASFAAAAIVIFGRVWAVAALTTVSASSVSVTLLVALATSLIGRAVTLESSLGQRAAVVAALYMASAVAVWAVPVAGAPTPLKLSVLVVASMLSVSSRVAWNRRGASGGRRAQSPPTNRPGSDSPAAPRAAVKSPAATHGEVPAPFGRNDRVGSDSYSL